MKRNPIKLVNITKGEKRNTSEICDFVEFKHSSNYKEEELITHLQEQNQKKTQNISMKQRNIKERKIGERERSTVTMAVSPRKWESIIVPIG